MGVLSALPDSRLASDAFEGSQALQGLLCRGLADVRSGFFRGFGESPPLQISESLVISSSIWSRLPGGSEVTAGQLMGETSRGWKTGTQEREQGKAANGSRLTGPFWVRKLR